MLWCVEEVEEAEGLRVKRTIYLISLVPTLRPWPQLAQRRLGAEPLLVNWLPVVPRIVCTNGSRPDINLGRWPHLWPAVARLV